MAKRERLPATTDSSPRPVRTTWIALLPALAAVLLYAPVWDGGLLADDLLLCGYATEPGPSGLRPDWQRIGADFAGPWAFGNGTYYRPLTTLTLALDHWVAGTDGWLLHCTSIALFAICVFAVGRWFGELFGAPAALLGGLLLAAHPAAHEPICWPCTRADFMVLAAAAAACTSFVRHLRNGSRNALFATAAWTGLALVCKENGLLLAAWFVVLDVALRGAAGPLRARLLPHLCLLPLWFGYLTLRWVTLGSPLPSGGAPPGVDLGHSWSALQLSKLRACLAPAGDALPWRTAWTLGALLATVSITALVQRAHRRWLAAGAVWIVVAMVPVAWLAVSPNLSQGRIVLASVLGVALVVAAVLARAVTPRWLRILGWLVAAVAIADLAAATRTIQARYRTAWQEMRTLREDFAVAARSATPTAPLTLLAVVPADREVPFLTPTMMFALAQPPLADREYPFVSLGFAHEPGAPATLMRGEVGPWRAMWEHGAPLCYWSAEHTDGHLAMLPRRHALGRLQLDGPGPDFTVPGAPASPWHIGRVVVTAPRAFPTTRLVWRSVHGVAGRFTLPPPREAGGTWTSTLDLYDDRDFLLFGTLGGVHGFTLTPAVADAAVYVLPPEPPFALPRPLRGAPLALDELGERLVAPPTGSGEAVTAVLMHKAFAFRVALAADRPTVVPADARSMLTEVDRFGGPDRIYYYLEADLDGRRRRSEVDWFERRRQNAGTTSSRPLRGK